MTIKSKILNALIRSRRDNIIFDIFHISNWSKSTSIEKERAINALELYMANKQGRGAYSIYYQDMPPGHFGRFDYLNDCILLSISLIKQSNLNVEAMDTVIHEGRHAYQFLCSDGLLDYDPSEKEMVLFINTISNH